MIVSGIDRAPHIRGKPIRGWPPIVRGEPDIEKDYYTYVTEK